MTPKLTSIRAAGFLALFVGAPVLGHPGHGAPSLHQHAGDPVPLVLLGVTGVATTAIVLFGRLLRRRGRSRSSH